MFRINSIRVTVLLVVVVLLASSTVADFPKDPKPCKHGDIECIKKMIIFLLRDHKDGYPLMHFPSVNPTVFPEISIKQNKGSPVNIDLNFRNCRIFGIETATVVHLRGFGEDLTQQHEITLNVPVVNWISDYTIKGKVLILPISGSGASNITLENVTLKLLLTAEPMVKDGKTYLNLKKTKVDIDPEKAHYHFSNLFNGDKTLGDTMNTFLNENSKEVFAEIRGVVSKSVAVIFQTIINAVFQTDAYEKLFE